MKHSVSEASRLTGKNRTTIHRHIKKGVISVEKGPTGNFLIDTSELERVYNLLHCNVAMQQVDTPSETTQVAVLQTQLEATKQMLQDTKKDRDDWKEQAQQAFMLLTNNSAKANKTKVSSNTEPEPQNALKQPSKQKKTFLRRLLSVVIES